MSSESSPKPDNPLTILRDLLAKQFNDSELRDLCFDLRIDYEGLSGSNKNDKARELVTYCERRGLLLELTQRIEELRAGMLPTNLASHISPAERLDRTQWLHARGFKIDPFSPEAFRAETDPLFNLSGLPAFIDPTGDPSDFEQLVGTPQLPGYRFIFAPAGGGKTSLRRYIVNRFNQNLSQWYPLRLPANPPFVLAVEYVLHDYDARTANPQSHIDRITQLVANRCRRLLGRDISFSIAQSSLTTLENIVNELRSNGLDGLCILVDNLDSGLHRSPQEIWELIQVLATRAELLTIEGLMFKFLLPIKTFKLAQVALPVEYIYEIRWKRSQLVEMLGQRLSACMQQQSGISGVLENPAAIAFQSLIEPGYGSRSVDFFTELGLRLGQPTEMWRLGHYLFEAHFDQSNDRRRSDSDLIRYETLDVALDHLTKAESEQQPLIIPYITDSSPASQFPLAEEESSGMTESLERIVNILERWDETEHTLFAVNPKKAKIAYSKIEESQSIQQENRIISSIEKLIPTLESLADALKTTISHSQQVKDSESSIDEQANPQDSQQVTIKKIEKLIEDDDLKRACEVIKDHLDTHQGIRFLRELNGIENDSINGIISRAELKSSFSDLANRILEWLKKHFNQHNDNEM